MFVRKVTTSLAVCLSFWTVTCCAQTLVPVRELEVSAGPITQVAFAPQGGAVAVTLDDPRMGWLCKISRLSSGSPLLELPGLSNSIHTVAFAPDGDIFAWAVGPRLLISSLSSKPGEHGVVINFPTSAVAFSPDGKLLAASSDEGKSGGVLVRLFDTKTGEMRGELRATHTANRSYLNPIESLRFSPDGLTLSAADYDQLFRWNLATMSEEGGQNLSGLSPQIAPNSQFGVWLWQAYLGPPSDEAGFSVSQLVLQGKKQFFLSSSGDDYQSCGAPSISPDSRFVAAPMWQYGKNFIAIWSVSDGKEILRRPVQSAQNFVTFGPTHGQEMTLASGYENSINKSHHAVLWHLNIAL